MPDKITWTNEKRKLSDLIPWERNPRKSKELNAVRLQDSLTSFGQVETIALGPQNELYNGHQRLRYWAAEFGPDLEVDVRVASRPLTEKEREKLTVLLHKGTIGEWDFESLGSWDVPNLLDWGFKEIELQINQATPNPHTRPAFDNIIEEFEEPLGDRGKSDKDGNWFYVEYYGQDETFKELVTLLKGALVSPHQLSSEYFLTLVRKASQDG